MDREHVVRLAATEASPAVLVIRLLAGGVLPVEGLERFLFAAEWGAGPVPGAHGTVRRSRRDRLWGAQVSANPEWRLI